MGRRLLLVLRPTADTDVVVSERNPETIQSAIAALTAFAASFSLPAIRSCQRDGHYFLAGFLPPLPSPAAWANADRAAA